MNNKKKVKLSSLNSGDLFVANIDGSNFLCRVDDEEEYFTLGDKDTLPGKVQLDEDEKVTPYTMKQFIKLIDSMIA